MNDYEETLLLGDFLDQRVADHPDRVVFQSRGIEHTYSQFSREVDKCAKAMLAMGLTKGSRVAVLSAQRTEVFITFFAAARLGILWLGVNPKYQLREMRHVMEDAKVSVFFGIENLDGRNYGTELNTIREEFSNIELFVGFDEANDYDVDFKSWINHETDNEIDYQEAKTKIDNNIDTMLIYTSGSSGTPKGVLLPQRAILKRAMIQWDYFYMDQYPRIMCPLPITHVGGIIVLPLFTMVGAGTSILMESFDLDQYVEAIATGKVNALMAVPAMHMLMLRHPKFSLSMLDNIQYLLWSGAKMPDEAVKIFYEAGCAIGSSYGITETSASVTFVVQEEDNLEVMTNSIGKAGPVGEVRIANEDVVCKPGESGEIQIRPEYSMSGYLNNEKATKAAFSADGWYRSGDIGIMREDGNIEFTSRMSEMFVSGGYNVYPLEIEQTLEAHDDIALCAVIEVDDEIYGQVGWAYIMPKPGSNIMHEEIKKWAYGQMANYKVPRKYFIESQLPLLPIGKIDKVSLRKRALKENELQT